MGSLKDELRKFAGEKGVRIVMDSIGTRVEPYEPLTVDDIDDFDGMEHSGLGSDELEDLLDKAEELQESLEEEEPDDEESDEHNLWEDRISETEDFVDRIRDRLEELEDEDSDE